MRRSGVRIPSAPPHLPDVIDAPRLACSSPERSRGSQLEIGPPPLGCPDDSLDCSPFALGLAGCLVGDRDGRAGRSAREGCCCGRGAARAARAPERRWADLRCRGSDLAATDTALLSSWARAGMPTNESWSLSAPPVGRGKRPRCCPARQQRPGWHQAPGTRRRHGPGSVAGRPGRDRGELDLRSRPVACGHVGSPLTISNGAADLRDMHVVGVGNRALLTWFEVAAGSGVVVRSQLVADWGMDGSEQVSETGEDSGSRAPL